MKTKEEIFHYYFKYDDAGMEKEMALLKQATLKCMQEYHDQFIPSDDEIKKQFNTSPDNMIHPDRFRVEGAMWLKERMTK